MVKQLIRLSVFAALAPCVMLAVPVLWTLSSVTFAGGGTATGSFVYNIDTNTYSSVNITVTGGAFPTSVYIGPHPQAASNVVAFVTAASGSLAGTRVLVFLPNGSLSNAGGTLTLVLALTEGLCSDAACNVAVGDRTLASGSLIGTAAPISVPALSPATMGLLFLLIAGTGLQVLRRNQSCF